jgi:hypothetical protein
MRWYYSGAKTLNGAQNTPSKSLGGYISSTMIPNSRIDSMFDELSCYTAQNGVLETKVFYIKNTTTDDVNDLNFFIVYPEDAKFLFKVAAVKANNVELLKTSSDIPYVGDFVEANVVFAYVDLTVIEHFEVDETVVIENVDVEVLDGKKATFMANAVTAFRNNETFTITALNTDVLRLSYIIPGVYTQAPEVICLNEDAITFTTFAGGVDNSQLLVSELKPDESLAIFLQRQPINYTKNKTAEEYAALFAEFEANDYQQLESAPLGNVLFYMDWSVNYAGNYTLTFDGQTTSPIQFESTADIINDALALADLTTVTATGDLVNGLTFDFTDDYAKTNVDLIVIDYSDLTMNGVPIEPPIVEEVTEGKPDVNEQQTITPIEVADDGTFTLSFDNKTTDPIPYDDTEEEINTALNDAGLGDLIVTGTVLELMTIEFTGVYAASPQYLIVIDTSLLTINDVPVAQPTVEESVEGEEGVNEQQTMELDLT